MQDKLGRKHLDSCSPSCGDNLCLSGNARQQHNIHRGLPFKGALYWARRSFTRLCVSQNVFKDAVLYLDNFRKFLCQQSPQSAVSSSPYITPHSPKDAKGSGEFTWSRRRSSISVSRSIRSLHPHGPRPRPSRLFPVVEPSSSMLQTKRSRPLPPTPLLSLTVALCRLRNSRGLFPYHDARRYSVNISARMLPGYPTSSIRVYK